MLTSTKERNKTKQWQPNAGLEQGKLAPKKESDWNLPGGRNSTLLTRTRHGGAGRPNIQQNSNG